MGTARRVSRMIGALILAQMVGGVLVNFVLTAPLFGAPGFLVNAAAHSQQIGLSVLLGLASAPSSSLSRSRPSRSFVRTAKGWPSGLSRSRW